ncbi:MAG TPA: hypothetical protein VGF99_21625 [Myxococcota bacterium]
MSAPVPVVLPELPCPACAGLVVADRCSACDVDVVALDVVVVDGRRPPLRAVWTARPLTGCRRCGGPREAVLVGERRASLCIRCRTACIAPARDVVVTTAPRDRRVVALVVVGVVGVACVVGAVATLAGFV